MRVVFLGVALLIGLVPLAAIAADTLGSADTTFVARVEGFTTDPRTNGHVIVYTRQIGDLIHGEMQNDLYGVDLVTHQRFTIAAGPGYHGSSDISGDIVVWAERSPDHSSRDILGKNLQTGETFTVAATAALEDAPVISGDWVVWHASDSSTSERIMARNLATMAPAITLTTLPTAPVSLTLDGDRAIWTEDERSPSFDTGSGEATTHWRLMSLAIGDQNPVTLAKGEATYDCEKEGVDVIACGFQAGSEIHEIAASSGVVVYHELLPSGAGRNTALDVATGRSTTFDGAGTNLTTDGRSVFWSGGDSGNGQIEGFDLASGSAFSTPANTRPDAADSTGQIAAQAGLLVWQEPVKDVLEKDQQPYVDLHASPIVDLLPTARRPDPGITSPSWTYFPATGHYIANGFQKFWQNNGGLPIFGYPLTEEVSEQGQTVQYLERQGFEYHPELAGTPYETELPRLGAEDAARRNLRGTQAFQPMEIPSTAVGDTCQYADETHHTICDHFLAYWQSHGLDFGDPGTSYRESLALFGYPIAEPFTDPDTGLRVQYFERALFEWHPANPVVWQVELGRLGALMLAKRGW